MRQREAWAQCWQRRLWYRLIRTRWLFWPSGESVSIEGERASHEERSRAAREREARKRAREGDLVRRAVVAILTALAQGRPLAVVTGEGAEGTGLRASAGASGPPER